MREPEDPARPGMEHGSSKEGEMPTREKTTPESKTRTVRWIVGCAGCVLLACSGDDPDRCEGVECRGHGACDPETGACTCDPGWGGASCDACDEGYVDVDGRCEPGLCAEDADCDDANACNGEETCGDAYTCQPGTPVVCGANEHCTEPAGECACDPGYVRESGGCVSNPCELPQAPTLAIVHAGAILEFTTTSGADLEVGLSTDPEAAAPEAWLAQYWLDLPDSGTPLSVKAFARIDDPGCMSETPFSFVYEVRDAYPPAASEDGTTAIHMDDPTIVAWATGWVDPVEYGAEVSDSWRTPGKAVGAASGSSTDVVCLGRGGSITMTFDAPIVDAEGWDLLVFENGLSDTFLELAWVEVSTDGATFLRFDNADLGDEAIGGFGTMETTLVGSLAGKYPVEYGTPFDLRVFVNRPEVRHGTVDLNDINYVRIVDVVGDGTSRDSFGDAIYDPYPTVGSAGFDLEAVGVIHQSP
jgi:hypothetical protein